MTNKTISSSSHESAMLEKGIQRFRKQESQARSKGKQYTTPAGISLTRTIVAPLAAAIQTFVKDSMKGKPGPQASTVAYLQKLDSWKAAFITSRAMLDILSKTKLLTTQALKLGSLIEDECRLNHFMEQMPAYYYRVSSDTLEWTTNVRRRKIRLMQAMVDKGIAWEHWEHKDKTKLGIKLIELFAEVSGIIQFRHIKSASTCSRLVIQATAEALQFVDGKNTELEVLKPLYGPLIEPPAAWTHLMRGGFHTLPLKLVKTQCREHLEALKDWPMPKVYHAVNALQCTPYRINAQVYQVARELKDRGLAIAGLPAPYNPAVYDKTGWTQKDFEVYRQGQILLNRNLEVELTLRCAKDYLDNEKIYFVHTLDFRGRAYPVTSYLSPQGDDLNRGLLTFAAEEAKPLGNDGACWLAIHGANCWGQGVDKASHNDRIQWVLNHSDPIQRAAADPLSNYWWTEADKPFQFLAFCFEWDGYLRDGLAYACSLPVAVDGSNNALQHFSALSRDPVIAMATNLLPSEKPRDIYEEVCKDVNRILEKDAQNGVQEAVQWQGHITRKDVKRPVMTQCYGAQEYGFRHMIFEDTLKDWRASGKPWPFERDGWKAATYLARVIKQALTSRLNRMEAYMQWLRTIARTLADQNLPVRWVNPAGFPVVQSYKRQGTCQIKTHLSGRMIRPRLNVDDPQKLDRRAQANGISANFIHSLDSAAMMLTIEQALANGITAFRMIHDSYSTVPADVPLLNVCLRYAFVEMYQDDVLGHFLDDALTILEKDATIEVPERPQEGDFDITLVTEADYFFS